MNFRGGGEESVEMHRRGARSHTLFKRRATFWQLVTHAPEKGKLKEELTKMNPRPGGSISSLNLIP